MFTLNSMFGLEYAAPTMLCSWDGSSDNDGFGGGPAGETAAANDALGNGNGGSNNSLGFADPGTPATSISQAGVAMSVATSAATVGFGLATGNTAMAGFGLAGLASGVTQAIGNGTVGAVAHDVNASVGAAVQNGGIVGPAASPGLFGASMTTADLGGGGNNGVGSGSDTIYSIDPATGVSYWQESPTYFAYINGSSGGNGGG